MYFEYQGERFKVLDADVENIKSEAGKIIEGQTELIIGCEDGALNIKQIQRQGKKSMSIDELLRGYSFEKGVCI